MSEHKCVVGTCCCGCSLRSGSMAIGIVTLVGSILSAIFGVYEGFNGVAVGWASLVFNVIILILSIILILGIRQERRGYVMAWVWGMVVLTAIQILMSFIVIFTTGDLSLAISTLIVMAITIYLIVVVRSFGLSLNPTPNMA